MAPDLDPDAPAGAGSGLFGLDASHDSAGVHVLSVPFEATVSHRRGSARAPEAILRASHQVDLCDIWTDKPYRAGLFMEPADEGVRAWNEEACALVGEIRAREGGEAARTSQLRRVAEIQVALNDWLHARVARALDEGRLVGVVGGDHSVSFGSIRAHAERYPGMGILHVDAHADLRSAYEGFVWSHASILRNVLERIEGLGTLVQMGVRDLGEQELAFIRDSGGRIRTLFDRDWCAAKHAGRGLVGLVRRALASLPREVYVSFDVDGLDASLCPNTGTPVPGGLTWDEAMLVLDELVRSGRSVVGFDLVEVAPAPGSAGEGWDEIVGARLLYRLIGFALASRSG